MLERGWRLRRVDAELSRPSALPPALAALPGDWESRLAEVDMPVGTPYLISPSFEYDVELNAFFGSAGMVGSAATTQDGYARDVKTFLNFLWRCRGGRSWRDATEADHTAYLVWRRRDPAGPRVGDATWDRQVAAVNRFYKWQVWAGNVRTNPVPQRGGRQAPAWTGRRAVGESPATYSHGAARERIMWLPAASYRRWRDVGMRGQTAVGLADPRFRGRWAGRNATFCDLMVRTGMRLSEQAGLTVFEVPLEPGRSGHRRFWLPGGLAKGGSARWIYVPGSIVADLVAYVVIDRAEVVAAARAAGRYRRIWRPLVVEHPLQPEAVEARPGGGGHRIKVEYLRGEERRRLFVDGPNGLEPAAFWLSEFGLPVAVSTWKGLFGDASARCRHERLTLHASAHMLRHTYAVITLEQLQRGHIAELAEKSPEQRGHYARTFGDPLDWVRRRLGPRSITTTQIYLHTLAELEMETRMALVPDDWDDPRDTPLSQLCDDRPGPDEA